MTKRSALTGWLAGILLLTVGSASLAQDPVAPDDPPAANLPAAPSLDTPRDILNEVANPAAPTLNAAAPADEIQIPADPLARAAFDVLERNCARCHQAGRIVGRLKPAKDFGFILELDKLAADPHYVTPGNPDGSRLIQMILNKEMPYDVYSEGDMSKAIPSEADETALRDWIASLGDTASSACDRRFVKTDEVVDAMAADLTAVQAARVASTRYITLTHLHNACASIAEMEVYRQATVKLLNSLSRVSDMVKLETVDEARTILRFNLNDLNWQAQDWETILAVYPYATRPPGEAFDALAKATATPLPYVRGDWFAFGAAQPPMYDALLHLPDNFAALEKDLGVDVAANIKRFVAARAGFDESGISVNNRVIERHAIPAFPSTTG